MDQYQLQDLDLASQQESSAATSIHIHVEPPSSSDNSLRSTASAIEASSGTPLEPGLPTGMNPRLVGSFNLGNNANNYDHPDMQSQIYNHSYDHEVAFTDGRMMRPDPSSQVPQALSTRTNMQATAAVLGNPSQVANNSYSNNQQARGQVQPTMGPLLDSEDLRYPPSQRYPMIGGTVSQPTHSDVNGYTDFTSLPIAPGAAQEPNISYHPYSPTNNQCTASGTTNSREATLNAIRANLQIIQLQIVNLCRSLRGVEERLRAALGNDED